MERVAVTLLVTEEDFGLVGDGFYWLQVQRNVSLSSMVYDDYKDEQIAGTAAIPTMPNPLIALPNPTQANEPSHLFQDPHKPHQIELSTIPLCIPRSRSRSRSLSLSSKPRQQARLELQTVRSEPKRLSDHANIPQDDRVVLNITYGSLRGSVRRRVGRYG